MNNTFYIYNNEALIIFTIHKILSRVKKIDISRLFLLISFLLVDEFTSYLLRVKPDNYKAFLSVNAKKIAQFSNIYYDLLPVILNALSLMAESETIKIIDCDIILYSEMQDNCDSIRLEKIGNTIPTLLQLTAQYTDRQLYDSLNIQL